MINTVVQLFWLRMKSKKLRQVKVKGNTMQINSVSNTNFGLTIHPSMQAILDKSEKEVAKQGRKELDLWRRNVKTLDKTAPDDYAIYVVSPYVVHSNDKSLLKPYSVWLQIPHGPTAVLCDIRKNGVIDINTLKDINKQIRDLKKEYDERNNSPRLDVLSW